MNKHNGRENASAPFATAIGRTRYVVLLAVVAVMLVSTSLFLLGTVGAAKTIFIMWNDLVTNGEAGSTEQIVESLSIIGVMLRAVVFYIIGVGLYSLFIAPLNLTVGVIHDSNSPSILATHPFSSLPLVAGNALFPLYRRRL